MKSIDYVLILDDEIFRKFDNYCFERNRTISEQINLMITEKMMEDEYDNKK